MSDYNNFKHGDEGTHYACPEMIDKFGDKVGCCGCNGHDCQPPQQKNTEWEEEFDKQFLLVEAGTKTKVMNSRIKAFINQVATQARQQAFIECLEVAPKKEELTGDTMNPKEILRGGFNQGVDEYKANIEKRMKDGDIEQAI